MYWGCGGWREKANCMPGMKNAVGTVVQWLAIWLGPVVIFNPDPWGTQTKLHLHLIKHSAIFKHSADQAFIVSLAATQRQWCAVCILRSLTLARLNWPLLWGGGASGRGGRISDRLLSLFPKIGFADRVCVSTFIYPSWFLLLSLSSSSPVLELTYVWRLFYIINFSNYSFFPLPSSLLHIVLTGGHFTCCLPTSESHWLLCRMGKVICKQPAKFNSRVLSDKKEPFFPAWRLRINNTFQCIIVKPLSLQELLIRLRTLDKLLISGKACLLY